MVNVGWWASDAPLLLGQGRRLGEKRDRPVRLSIADSLRGIYINGGTGSGKSVAIDNITAQHVRAGRGFMQIDADDLNRLTLARIAELALPGALTAQTVAGLGDKLIVLDLADQRYGCPAYNFLQPQPGLQSFELVEAIVDVLRERWTDAMGARLLDISKNSLLCLAEHGLTIAEMPLFLSHAGIRDALVRRSQNVDVKTFFLGHLAGLRPNDQRVWFESSRNKWAGFGDFIRPFVGQTQSTINARNIIDSGKILLVILNRAHIKHESRSTLGALILNVIHAAALAREDTPRHLRIYFAIIIDEMQTYYTSTIDSLVEGGRKYSISTLLAHQSTRQNPFVTNRGAIDNIIANCHARFSFSLSRQDAERMAAEYFTPSGSHIKYQDSSLFGLPTERPQFYSMGEEMQANVAELMHQRPGEGFVSFKGLADDHRPYMIRAPLLPAPQTHPEKIDAVMRHLAARYYRPLPVINQEINERWTRLRALAEADAEQHGGGVQTNDFRR